MIPVTEIPMWRRVLREDPLFRDDMLTPDAELDLELLWYGCGQDKDIYIDAAKTLSWSYGLNIMRKRSKAAWQPPEPRRDSEGRPLPNPFETGNRRDQEALIKTDPELAADLKERASNPYAYQLKLEAAERDRQRWNKAVAEYDHAQNPFVNGDRAQVVEFIRKCEEEGTPEKLEIYKREALPVEIKLFDPIRVHNGKVIQTKNREVINQIGHDGNKRLLKIIEAGQQRRKALDLIAHQRAEAQRVEDAKTAERQRRAHDEVLKGIRHLPDGRRITMPGRHA